MVKKVAGAVLLDFSVAFDVIDHELLLKKLSAYGFSANAVSWMKGYLTNRMQCVYFNGCFSASGKLNVMFAMLVSLVLSSSANTPLF